jgi:hypothetical protein
LLPQKIEEGEAREVEDENALAKTTQEQSKYEEVAIGRLNALSIAFGSKLLLTCDSFCSILYLCANPDVPCCSRKTWGNLLVA